MSRLWFLGTGLVLACVAACSALLPEGYKYDPSDPPNFLFIMADDQGWGDVSYNKLQYQPGAGGEQWTHNPPRTPNLDAWANGSHTLLFHRFYAGSGVCSPTRSAFLTGRTPNRECIYSAEGCGQQPAWKCVCPYPLPTETFTLAEAAKMRNYSTIHVGKWHLGDFFPKNPARPSHAQQKWPSSHPGMHGFDEWVSTEASASSSTTNCGCDPDWKNQGQGCIVGGGTWERKALECTNYWFPTDLNPVHEPNRTQCHAANTTDRTCVGNLTQKITGDDSEFQIDRLEDFIKRKTSPGPEKAPFMAIVWLHTNHVPHPSLPQFYHAYTDAEGRPAGDYLGTLTQMDVQIGRVRQLLQQYNIADNTLLWYTADNGPHLAGEDHRSSDQATNGLRQCKASLFEGGIREPGLLEWPAVIKEHRETSYPAYVSDYLPTVLEVLGLQHPQPNWPLDGISLMPLIQGAISDNANRTAPMGFWLGSQQAWIENEWKLVYKPEKGQCPDFLPPYGKMKNKDGPFLFNLNTDPTETNDLSKQETARFQAMQQRLANWSASVEYSQTYESGCKAAPPTPKGAFQLQVNGSCLILKGAAKHDIAVLGSCTDQSATWTSTSEGLASVSTSYCLKQDGQKSCHGGGVVWSGTCQNDNDLYLQQDGSIQTTGCSPTLCVTVNPSTHETSLQTCNYGTKFKQVPV